MRSFKHAHIGLALFMLLVGLAGEAAAQVPNPNVYSGGNRWIITGYNDASPVHQPLGSQGICFLPFAVVGTGVQGVWFSDTFPNWSGRYRQEGDQLVMHGNWANFRGSDGIIIDLHVGPTPRDVGGGHWTEWWNFGANGTTIGFANASLRRVGKCHLPTHVDTMSQAELETLSAERSQSVGPRLRRDGKVAEYPTDPEQVPLPEETSPEQR